jgi:hypothetical protein
MKRPQFTPCAERTRRHASARRTRRQPVVEPLEARWALNAAPSSAANQAHPSAAAPNPTPPSVSASAAISNPTAADSSATPPQGILDLLFTPHRPKSGVPADVISGIGPPLQQGAPIIYSFELEDNLTGGERGDLRARENPQRPTVPPIIQPELANIGNVDSTPYGVPNFSFGPDTWVFGPQEAASPERRVMQRPESSGAGESQPRDGASPGGPNDTTTAPRDDDRGSSMLRAQPLELRSVRLTLDESDAPENDALGGPSERETAVDAEAADRLFVDQEAVTE